MQGAPNSVESHPVYIDIFGYCKQYYTQYICKHDSSYISSIARECKVVLVLILLTFNIMFIHPDMSEAILAVTEVFIIVDWLWFSFTLCSWDTDLPVC